MFCFVEHDILSVIRLHNTRLHVLATGIGGGVHVGNKANHGFLLLGIGGEGSHKVAVVVEAYLCQSEGNELIAERLGKHHLTGGGRREARVLIRSGAESGVLDKSFGNRHRFIYYFDFYCILIAFSLHSHRILIARDSS